MMGWSLLHSKCIYIFISGMHMNIQKVFDLKKVSQVDCGQLI